MQEPASPGEPRPARWNWRRVLIASLALLTVTAAWMQANSTSEGVFLAMGAQVTAVQPRCPAFIPAYLWEAAIPRSVVMVSYQSNPLPAGLLRRIERLSSVRRIDLCRTDLDDAGLAQLSRLKVLEELILDGTQVTDEGLKSLGRLKSLRKLSVLRTAVTASGLEELERLIGRTGFRDAAEVAGLRDLFPLAQWGLGTPGIQIPIRNLAIHPRSPEDTLSVEAVARLRAIVDLDELIVPRLVTEAIPLLEGFPNLRSLSLTADDSQLPLLGKLRHLEHLHLIGSRVTDSNLSHLASLPLRTLKISGSRIEGSGLGPIFAIPTLETLEIEFDPRIRKTRLSDVDSPEWKTHCDRLRAVLAEAPPNPNLTRLVLRWAPLDDAGCGELTRLTSLEYLVLKECASVGDSGAAKLRALPLETLSLIQTSVSPELLKAFGRFPTLQLLVVGFAESSAPFQKVNPRCNVTSWMVPELPATQGWAWNR